MMNPSPHRYLAGKTIVLLSATLFLTGCSTIGTRIEESIQNAQALHDRCEQVDDAIGSETGSVTYGSIAERVKLRLEEACTDPSQPKASGVGADQCVMDWEQRVRSIWTQVTPTDGDQNNFQAAAAVVETAAGAIRDDKLKIANDLNILIGSWTNNAKKDTEFCKQSRQACADQIIGFLTSSTNVAAFGVLRADITKLQTDGQTFDSALSALAGPTAAATSNASTSIQAALQQLRGLQAELDGSISDAAQAFQALDDKDNAAAVKTMLASRFYPEAAEKSLRLIQRGLTPVDRLIDKIDDKTYLVSGIVMEVYQNKIQDAFDEIYARYVRKTIPFQGQVALAKAACTELEAAPISSDPPPSTTMDFSLRSLPTSMRTLLS